MHQLLVRPFISQVSVLSAQTTAAGDEEVGNEVGAGVAGTTGDDVGTGVAGTTGDDVGAGVAGTTGDEVGAGVEAEVGGSVKSPSYISL